MGEHREKGMTWTSACHPHHWPDEGFATAVDGAAGHRTHTPAAVATARDPTMGRRPCGWFPLLLLAPASISQRLIPRKSGWQESLGNTVWTMPLPPMPPGPARPRTSWEGGTAADSLYTKLHCTLPDTGPALGPWPCRGGK